MSAQANEHARLLGDRAYHPPATDVATANQGIQSRTKLATILFICALYFNVYVCLAPESRIREDIVCRAYYNKLNRGGLAVDPSQHDCTADGVQKELSLLTQIYMTLSQLPGFMFALPYGIMADRVGRKRVLRLSIIGLILCDTFKLVVIWQSDYIPLRMIWLAPVFRMIGGGDAVAATMVLAALADVYENEERTIVFTRVASMATVCELISPLIASALMPLNPWIPISLGFTLFSIGAIIILTLLPETSQYRLTSDAVDNHNIDSGSCTIQYQTPGGLITKSASIIARSLSAISANRNVLLLLFGFFATTVGTVAAGFELQYVHKRYGWSYARASSLLAIRPFVTIIVLLVLIPISSKILLVTCSMSNAQKDLILVRGSATLLTIGTLLLGISEVSSVAVFSFVIFALGNGFTTVSKSLLTTFGPHEMAGTLLSAMNVSAALGAVIAGPLITVTFNLGLEWGGAWIGTPLFFITLLYVLTLASVCIMKASEDSKHVVTEDLAA